MQKLTVMALAVIQGGLSAVLLPWIFKTINTMKKLSILLMAAMTFMACNKCLPQRIPPHTIYADSNCQGVLPDFTIMVDMEDNCPGGRVGQDPQPGTIMDAGSPWITVTLTAFDAFDNPSEQESFDVLLIDTIPPKMIIDTSLMTWDQRFSLLDGYRAALRGYISDSILDTYNMVTVSYPNGHNISLWQEPSLFPAVPMKMEDF